MGLLLCWYYLASLGALGGVLLKRDKSVVQMVEDCIGYYLVVVSFPSEMVGPSMSTGAMKDFLELIFDLNLVDLSLVGCLV